MPAQGHTGADGQTLNHGADQGKAPGDRAGPALLQALDDLPQDQDVKGLTA